MIQLYKLRQQNGVCVWGGKQAPGEKAKLCCLQLDQEWMAWWLCCFSWEVNEYRHNITRDKFYRSQKCRIVNKICYFNIILNKKFKSSVEQAQNTKYMISALTDIFWVLLKFCDILWIAHSLNQREAAYEMQPKSKGITNTQETLQTLWWNVSEVFGSAEILKCLKG